MARWLVQLEGERFDLEEFPFWFPNGDVFVFEENGNFFLTGRALDKLAEAEAVRKEALKVVDQFTAIISLFQPNLRKPHADIVLREDDAGRRSRFLFASVEGLSVRVKMHGALMTAGEDLKPPRNTQAQVLLSTAQQNPNLRTALEVWGEGGPSWPRLYRILEEIEKHLGRRVDQAGLCSEEERTRFRRTANSAEVAGKDSRHALGKFLPPDSPITLADASSYVGRLLLLALRPTPRPER